jgi:sugar O-acyltransferase (sialic acid O-acetyltransferase NeuD family)
MKPLWILGAGGHGAVVADAALLERRWSTIELFDDDLTPRPNLKIAGTYEDLRSRIGTAEADVAVAVGNNLRRLQLCEQLLNLGAQLTNVIHPSAIISATVTMGTGNVILAGAVLNPRTRIGMGCIVNTRASIDHDCSIGDGVHICPGVALAGNVTIRDRAWIGIGSAVIQGITIGQDAIVGAGAAVIRDVPDGSTVVGCPAREIIRA